MPKLKQAEIDRLYALLMGAATARNISVEDIARATGCSASTIYTRIRQRSVKQWPFGDIIAWAKACSIPVAELREAMKY